MAFSQFFLLFCFAKFLAASSLAVKKGSASETYRKLFKPAYLNKLEEGDTAAAKKALAEELDVSFIPEAYEETKTRIERILDEEKLTEEAFCERRYETLAQAKAAYKSRDEVEKQRQDEHFRLLADIQYYKYQQTSPLRPVYDALNHYFPSLADRVDPLVGAPAVPDLEKQLDELDYERGKRQKFIEDNPRWFLKKGYYTKDQFGLERAKMSIAENSVTGEVFEGDGQTILVMDSFNMIMPSRVRQKCVNYDEFKNVLSEKDTTYHGNKVASVAVDSEIGVAKNAKFRAAQNLSYMAGSFPINWLNLDPVCKANVLKITDLNIGPDLLRQIDAFLSNAHPRFALSVSIKGVLSYQFIDASTIKIPEETVINMSFAYIDHIGRTNNRNIASHLPQLIKFITMILVFARAGKILVWAAGNDAISVGDSLAYQTIRALSQYKPECFISALALDDDNVSMSNFSNQPGSHPIQFCSLSAPGTHVPVIDEENKETRASGTSFAAPYISGAMALLMSNYPDATAQEVRDALIYMAAPVVLKWSESRNGYFPLVIRGARNGTIIPGQNYTYFGKDFERDFKTKEAFVTGEMIQRGREKYGAGIINISGAATYLHMKHTDSEIFDRALNISRENQWLPHLA